MLWATESSYVHSIAPEGEDHVWAWHHFSLIKLEVETGKLVNRRRVLFTVTEFREKYEERMNDAVQKVQKVDVSEIYLQPEGASKPVTLVYRKTRVTYRAVLELPIDNWKRALDQGALFNLRSEEFRVVEIEVEPGRALIMRTADKARFWVDGQGVTPVKGAPDADGDR